MFEPLQFFAPAVAALAAAIVATDRRLVRELRRVNAVSPESAVRLNYLRPLRQWRLSRLASAAVVRFTAGGNTYLDESAWQRYRRRRRIRVLLAIAFVAAVFFTLWAFSVIEV